MVKLNKNCKKEFFDNLEIKNNSKSLWDKCKPYFSNKHSIGDSGILLIEKDELLLKNKKVDLSSNKAAGGEIPLIILKKYYFSFHLLTNCINEAIKSTKFPDSLKLSNIVPVHKKKDPTDKTNYRPVSILPLLTKVFEKVMYIQLYDYMETFLNQLLCGSRKAHSTQHALFRLIQS